MSVIFRVLCFHSGQFLELTCILPYSFSPNFYTLKADLWLCTQYKDTFPNTFTLSGLTQFLSYNTEE